MLAKIFTSKVRVKLLRILILNPKNRYYVRELERLTHLPYTAVRRELANLYSFGLLKTHQEGRQKYFQVDERFFLYPELKNIMLKTAGLSEIIQNKLLSKKDIEIIFVFGSYAKDQETTISDIDLLVIGRIKSEKLHKILEPLEDDLGRDINYLIFTKRELRNRLMHKDHFITSVFKEPKIFLKGTEDELRKISSAA